MATCDPATLHDELTCSICLELFENPVTLPCDHSMCRNCLEGIRRSSGILLDLIKCPLCRKTIDLATDVNKNLTLKRIVSVYKDDLVRRMERSASCLELSAPTGGNNKADKKCTQYPEYINFTQLNAEGFCKRLSTGSTDNQPLRPSASVLELREILNHDGPSQGGSYLTKCTAGCSNPPNKAAVLCVQCRNQYCRLCWEGKHSLDKEENQGHNLNVYGTAFQDEAGNDIECNNCDIAFPLAAKFICFHCNISFCEECYQKRHPILLIQHFIVKRPEVLPIQKPCSNCTINPPNLASSMCKLCKGCFCSGCLSKITKHGCLKSPRTSGDCTSLGRFSFAERQVQRELVNLMKLRKQLIDEIPTFIKNKVSKVQIDLKLGDRVVYFEDMCVHKGCVKWIGKRPGRSHGDNLAGIEFDNPVGNGDGMYEGQRLFQCLENRAGFIPLLQLIKEGDYKPDSTDFINETNDLESDSPVNDLQTDYAANDLETDSPENDLQTDSPPNDLQADSPPNDIENGFDSIIIGSNIESQHDLTRQNRQTKPNQHQRVSKQTLLIGELVAYFNNGQLYKGVVKWIGVLPNDKKRDVVVGVEFDEPIGSGTGKYCEHRLFYAKSRHASLIPIAGLMRYEDL